MADQWQPANELEAELSKAIGAQDLDLFLKVLAPAELLLPGLPPDAGPAPFRFYTQEQGGVRYVFAFTSPEAMMMMLGLRAQRYHSAQLRDLAALWPDHQMRLVIDPGHPLEFEMYAAHLTRVAGWEFRDPISTGAANSTSMSKFITAEAAADLLANGGNQVSGYVYRADELGELDRPERIVPGLNLDYENSGFSADDEVVFQLVWPAFGEALYAPAYGGNTPAEAELVEGLIVDDRPFRGTGFVPTAQGTVEQFKVSGLTLPYGTAMLANTATGERKLLAVYNADNQLWRVLMRQDLVHEYVGLQMQAEQQAQSAARRQQAAAAGKSRPGPVAGSAEEAFSPPTSGRERGGGLSGREATPRPGQEGERDA